MIALDVGFIATALAAGVAIGGHCAAFSSRDGRREDRSARDHAVEKALEWQAVAADRATELEFLQEEHHAERDRADRAEAQAAAWELRARHLAIALEQFVPREVDATGNVVRFPDRAAG